MSKRNQMTYTKPDPPFLRRIREQVGYKEIVNIDTKKQDLDRDNLEDGDDEKPTIVITENSNVSKEEQEDYAEKINEVKPAKILFKKPVKKDLNESEKNKSTLKRPLDDKDKDDKAKKIKQKVDNNRLLSFGDDDDEEDDS